MATASTVREPNAFDGSTIHLLEGLPSSPEFSVAPSTRTQIFVKETTNELRQGDTGDWGSLGFLGVNAISELD